MAIDTTDHVEEGLALLIEQYRDKPRLAALLSAFLNRCNELEAIFVDIIADRDVDTAVAAQLDTLGALVGQPRIGPTDSSYRLFIKTRIRANRSLGQSEDVIAVSALATNGAEFVVRDKYPASIIVDVLTQDVDDIVIDFADYIASILRQTAGAGVAIDLHWATFPPDEAFTFADGDDATADTDRGWGDVAGSIGGKWIEVS